MCGITGFIDFNKKIELQHLTDACDTLSHRGPDDRDAVILESSFATIGLGHRRLSILDLSALGHQPMYSEDKSVVIILNGEIYNFKEIRAGLQQKGHTFKSDSDTEVILKAYELNGMDCLQQFIGMFAFAIYDSNKQKVFLVRDRAGVKPMYYTFSDGRLLFGSELKALHRYPGFKKDIDPEAVSLFFRYGYIKAPYSIFKNVHKLMPGNYAEMDLKSQQLHVHQYWDVLDYYNKPTLSISEAEATVHLDKLFTSAFQYRMVSDVPVGVFLSGGYDSSLVAAVLQKNSSNKIKTFTIGFKEEKYNEAHHAKKVADYLGTQHNEHYCTTKEAQEIIPTLPFYFDEPFGDSSAIPTILVSKFARQQVTVALSADAGDEIFAGYNRYDQLVQLKKIQHQLPGFLHKPAAGVLNSLAGKNARVKKIASVLSAGNDALLSDTLNRHFTDASLKKLLKKNNSNIFLIDEKVMPQQNDFINKMLAADYKTYMVDDILTKVDRATMSVGLEGREPLLDHRIVEFAAQLPSSMKYNNGSKKHLLKKITHQYIPAHLMERPKMGFGLPVYEWFRGDLKHYLFQYICKEKMSRHGLFDEMYAEKIRDYYLAGKKGYETQVWFLLVFQLWWEKWMN